MLKAKTIIFDDSIHNDYALFTQIICTDNVDPDQTQQNMTSDQGLYCFSLLQHFLFTSSDSKIDLVKF